MNNMKRLERLLMFGFGFMFGFIAGCVSLVATL